MLKDYSGYKNIVVGKCLKTHHKFSLKVGRRYTLGVRYNTIFQREVYHILEVTDCFGIPVIILKEENFFEEELRSISFILT